jgi:AcrR family transcriptional regulator
MVTNNVVLPKPVSDRRARRRKETRDRIFNAAMKLFSERGFLQTTVEDITEAADVGKGTFFNYFPAKEHVLGVFAEVQRGKVEAALATARTRQESVRETVFRLIHSLAEYPSRSQVLTRSLLIALLSSEPVRERLLVTLAEARVVLAEVFTIAQQRHEISSDRDSADLAMKFQQLMFGSLALWAIGVPDDFKTYLDRTFEIFWAGAAAPLVELPARNESQDSGNH